jgi:cysteine desulfurase/selenocysteine lyase
VNIADVERWRDDFPILETKVRGKRLVYLDNGATTQKPQAVIDAERDYYTGYNSNVHRGVHTLSQKATEAYEAARETVRSFINAKSVDEIVFVRGTTEAINLVASSFGRTRIAAGDEIIVSEMEHHSNIVPWQLLCEQTGAVLKVVPISDAGELRVEEFEKMLSPRVKLVAIVHVSNALGTINPIASIVEKAHAAGAVVLVDGAQAVAHMPVDVQALDVDFYAFSSHKLYGPTGIGVLYGRRALLETMPPYQGGGDMIRRVSFAKTEYNQLPYKFEAGTPNIAAGIALKAAIDYVSEIGLPAIAAHEADLLRYATDRMSEIPEVRIIGTAKNKGGLVSFVMDGAHPHDIGTILDHEAIAIRAGHHCAMPVMERYRVPATARASFALYNTRSEIDALITGLHKVKELLRL